MRRSSASAARRRGSTLIGVIATIVIIGAIGSVSGSVLLNAMNGYAAATVRSRLVNEASVALDRIVKELRNIPLRAQAGVAVNIQSTTASSIAYGGNSSITLNGSQIDFVDAGATSRVLVAGVSAFTITTFDHANTQLAAALSGNACDPIRRVQITLSLTSNGITETIRAKVYIRSAMQGASGV
ncbi:MAG: hypothetical protein IBJ11_02745 [Phycisphaerales bacterium]|nr:hypothetical protein [Phycisphaerales bacterium]